MALRVLVLAAVLALHRASGNLNPEPAPDVMDSTAAVAPAPGSTSSSHDVVTTSFYKKPGTCCKEKNSDGSCKDISNSNPTLFNNNQAPGTNNWCGVPFCACGNANDCFSGTVDACGYNSDSDSKECLCGGSCYGTSSEECCSDFETVCNIAAPAPKSDNPSPSPLLTTSTVTAVVGTLRGKPAPSPSTQAVTVPVNNPTASGTTGAVNNLAEEDNSVVIIASVSVVVAVVIVIVVIFSVKHIRQKQAESRPLFVDSTPNTTSPRDKRDSPGSTRASPEVELSTRSKSYESGRGGSSSSKRSKKKKKKKTPKTPSADESPAVAMSGRESTPTGTEDASSTKSSSSRRSRRSPTRASKSPKTKSSSKSPKKSKSAASTPHAHDDVFASPTHHNFEL